MRMLFSSILALRESLIASPSYCFDSHQRVGYSAGAPPSRVYMPDGISCLKQNRHGTIFWAYVGCCFAFTSLITHFIGFFGNDVKATFIDRELCFVSAGRLNIDFRKEASMMRPHLCRQPRDDGTVAAFMPIRDLAVHAAHRH